MSVNTIQAMPARQYKGMRYVPIFDGDWDNTKDYDPLTIVSYHGNSYTSRTFVPAGTAISDTEYWALTGNYNAQVEAYRQEVAELAEDVSEIDFNKVVRPHELTGNIIIDYFYDRTNHLGSSGSCYIGNNKIVVYFLTDTDTGILKCFNLNTISEVWSYPIKAYHGNNMAYRPTDNCLYITGDDGKIVVVDMANPSVVKEEIQSPSAYILSIGYDMIEDKFYSINNNGYNDGEANRLYKYAGIFDAVESYVDLKDYPAVEYKLAPQGIGTIQGGIVYILSYAYDDRYIVGNDITTGKAVLFAKQPKYLNGYRIAGESEGLIYDYDNDRWFISAFGHSGIKGWGLDFVYEIDLYKGIDVIEKTTMGAYGFSSNYDLMPVINVVGSNLSSLKPYDNNNVTNLKSLQDAVTCAKLSGKTVEIIVNTDKIITKLVINGFKGYIHSANDATLEFEPCPLLHGVNAQFKDCTFSGKSSGYTIYLNRGANVSFKGCTFNDSESLSGVFLLENSSRAYVDTSDCTFNSSARKYLVDNSSKVVTPKCTWTHITSDKVDVTADTWACLSNNPIQLEDAHSYMEVFIQCSKSGSSGEPLGVALTTSPSSPPTSGAVYKFEDSVQLFRTPVMLITPNVPLYVWLKYEGSSTNSEYGNIWIRTNDLGKV